MATTIAIRYSHARKQFGPINGEEIPVIEYQMQQWRLLPYLAASYVWYWFSLWLNATAMQMMSGNEKDSKRALSFAKEIHALSCSAKALSAWIARDSIQEAREACGGHGYLSINRLGPMQNDNDPNCTGEGDNNCILMDAFFNCCGNGGVFYFDIT